MGKAEEMEQAAEQRWEDDLLGRVTILQSTATNPDPEKNLVWVERQGHPPPWKIRC